MKLTHIVIHHTGGTDANPMQDSSNFTFKQCDAQHRQSFNFKSSLGFYCGYQYYIEKDGKLFKAREDDEEGAHTVGQNKNSIGICLAGNFDATDPTTNQVETLKTLLGKKMAQWSIPAANIVPHRKFATKTCYGRRLPDDWAQKLVNPPPVETKEDIKKQIYALIEKL